MIRGRKLKIVFMGAKQAGMLGALAVLARGHRIVRAVSYSPELSGLLKSLSVPVHKSIREKKVIDSLKGSDILLSVHGREIVRNDMLQMPKIGAVNIHPYLYKYKGTDPVGRAFRDKEFRGSVGAHIMEERVDCGRVLAEEFVDVGNPATAVEIYNVLYPLYPKVIMSALDAITRKSHRKERRRAA